MLPFSTRALPEGIWTALVTPFRNDGSLDIPSFRSLVQRQLDAGIHALVPCGTTGESATLSDAEKVELVKICIELADGKTPVIAGAGHNDTRQAIALHNQMKELGATACLHVTPYYNKPTQEGLYRHFKAIAQSCDMPIVLYNVPSRTGVNLLPPTVLRLAKEIAHIVAIKETSTDLTLVQPLISDLKLLRPDFLVLSGEDAFLMPILSLGAHGLISVGSNFAPKLFVEVFELVKSGDLRRAEQQFSKIVELTRLMFMVSNPIPVKTALSLKGFLNNAYRLPLCPMNTLEEQELKSGLKEQGWL